MSPRKILIVDDHPMIRHLIKMTLQFENYAVIEAVDAQDGFKKATLIYPDLIILDINLQDQKNGLDLCQQLKEVPALQNTRYIILTVSKFNIYRDRAQKLNIFNFLNKPFKPSYLIETVKGLLNE